MLTAGHSLKDRARAARPLTIKLTMETYSYCPIRRTKPQKRSIVCAAIDEASSWLSVGFKLSYRRKDRYRKDCEIRCFRAFLSAV